jgi:monoamine oxidase
MGGTFDRRRFLLASAAVLAAGACHTERAPAPSTPAAHRPRILVLGAGLSGLVAAHDLMVRGHDVTVLEAQDRPGGRMHTLRMQPAWGDLHVEAGAIHVVGDPDLLRLMASMGVSIEPRRPRPRGLSRVQFAAGKRSVFAPGTEPPSLQPLSPAEEALGWEGCMEKFFPEASALDPNAPPPSALARHDAQSLADFLRQRGASPGYVASIQEMFRLGDGPETVSALSVLRELAHVHHEMTLEGGGRIAGGSDRLPRAIADRLGARVLYGAVVRRIEQDGREARVVFHRRGETATLSADHVICTIPFSVLRHLEVQPAFSAEKQRAIQELSYVSVTRLFLGARSRFWTARGESGDVETDLPMGPVRDETALQPGEAGVLGIYATGAEARRLGGMENGVDAVLEAVERVHPGLRERYAGGMMHDWDREPYSRGAYPYFKPGQMTALGPHLSRPEGRIHFAGDHTSSRPGFMHGALASARRVVEEIAGAG